MNHSCLLLLCTFAVLLLSGCQKAEEKRAEDVMKSVIEKTTGKKADVDLAKNKISIKGEGGNTEINLNASAWPAEIPADVPQFKVGII